MLKWILSFLACMPPVLGAVQVQVHTHKDLVLDGRVRRVSETHLFLQVMKTGSPVEVGVALADVDSILLRSAIPETEFLDEMESLLPVLPYWGSSVHQKILRSLPALAEKKDWPATYRWSSRLLETELPPSLLNECALHRAWALHQLGLHQQAREEATHLAKNTDPLTAPSRLCQLMATLASNPGEKSYWDLLPSLQIPSHPPSVIHPPD